MYDPILGRWLEQDPIGFDAGDMNLYRFVGNTPTSEVDPSGLEATRAPDQDEKEVKDKVKDAVITFSNGATGRIKVFRDVEIILGGEKRDRHNMQFEFILTKAADKVDFSKLHWVQIVRTYQTGGDTVLDDTDRTYSVKEKDEKYWCQHGKKHIYNDGSQSSYEKGGEKKVSATELSIFDRPEYVIPDDKHGFYARFDTFLVYDGKPYYHIHWRAQQNEKDKYPLYFGITGQPISGKISDVIKRDKQLVDFLKKDDLIYGYRERKDKYTVDPETALTVKNLIDPKFR